MVPWDKMPVLQWDAYESDWKSTPVKDTQQAAQAKCPASSSRALPLGVLRCLAGALQSVFLALFDPRIPGQQTFLA